MSLSANLDVLFQVATPKPGFSGDDFIRLLPEFIVLLTGVLLVIIDLILPKERRGSLSYLAVIGYIGAIVASAFLFNYNPPAGNGFFQSNTSFSGMFVRDNFTTFSEIIFLSTGLLSILLSPRYALNRSIPIGEFYTIQVFAVLGMMIVGASGDLMAIFVGIELSSIGVYILTGFARNDRGSSEGAMKYFLLGILATAILVYGMTWCYGMTGSTNLAAINTAIAQNPALRDDSGLTFAMLLMVVGFGFKIAAVPFHVWTPDAYEGAPTPITAFMSVGPKAAGFAALVRVMVQGLPALASQWAIIIAVLAVLTMTLGNIVAISQKSVKRMLAYSSIAHTGYIMIGLAAFTNSASGLKKEEAIGSVLVYSLIYVFMNIGAFGILIWLQNKGQGADVDDFNGLGSWAPLPALAMAVFLFSLTGLPPTGGFFGKFFVFRSAIDNGLAWLAIVGAVNSAISAFFYLRIIVAMYFRPAPENIKARVNAGGALFISTAMVVAAVAVLFLGILPGPSIDLAKSSAEPLFRAFETVRNAISVP